MSNFWGNTTNTEILGKALGVIVDDLTNVNAHTLAALLEWHYKGTGNDDLMAKAYDAARQVLAAKND